MTVAAVLITSSLFLASIYLGPYATALHQRFRMKAIRKKLPRDITVWRFPRRYISIAANEVPENQIWHDLGPVFSAQGFTLWEPEHTWLLRCPGPGILICSGFGYVTASRGLHSTDLGAGPQLTRYNFSNPLTRMARTSEGHDMAVRIIAIGDEGKEHLKILRILATTPTALLNNNHCTPMWSEFHFQEIIFGIFPKVGGTLSDAYDSWAKNSVGDVADMLMQALEGLAFIHEMKIAHRDAFRDNILIQWQPESMRTMSIAISRPRVYWNDFELGISFPDDCPDEECSCVGLPFDEPGYGRRAAPEMLKGEPYDPFKADVWQLGDSFNGFRANIPEIDGFLRLMVIPDPKERPTSRELVGKLSAIINSMTPQQLLVAPEVVECMDS